MVNKVRTLDFLPEIFRTQSNAEFLNSTLDVLVDQPNLKRVEGFIGAKYGYGVNPLDKYVVEPSKSRSDYQLDPSVVFLKPDTQTAQDFISYPGIVSALKLAGAKTDNADRLFSNEFYSWDPFVDYDKIVNYSQYYWIPNGPDAVIVSTTTVYETAEYTVTADDNGYTFNQVAGINPSISMLRGGTYTFNVGSSFTPFWIQTVPGIDATVAQRTIPGVTNNGVSGGILEFIVPDKTTFTNDVLYYQSGSDPNSVGIINLIETNSSNTLFVQDILGRKTYTSPNGIKFTNGLKVEFDNTAYPEEYRGKQYYVEGVGSSIDLLPVDNFVAAEYSGEIIYAPWDVTPWDISVWSEILFVPVTPEYITVSRNSRDYNAWTRANRWFHQDVINTTVAANGVITNQANNTVTRAQRPIIEYRGNLKLFNSGVYGLGGVDIFDTTTTDAFTNIEGKTISQVGLLDGIQIQSGTSIVFAADTNPSVRGTIYTVTLVPNLTPGEGIINLVPDTSRPVVDNSQVFVYWVAGSQQGGASWWFDSADNQWHPGQKKTYLNQYPLFDMFDASGNSLGDSTVYNATTFNGTKLFSYTPGTGNNDPVLGFPIAYSNIDTIGDILFTVNINSDTFNYNQGSTLLTENVNIGFVHWYNDPLTPENLSGWVNAAGPSFQPQVFEFPVITEIPYTNTNVIFDLVGGGSGYQAGDQLRVPGNLLGGTTPENDLFFTVGTVSGGVITSIDIDSISGSSIDTYNTFYGVNTIAVTGNGSSAILNITVTGISTTTFTCDILALSDPAETPWNPVVVYYGDDLLDTTKYTVTRDTINNETSVTVPSAIGAKVTVTVISDQVSSTAYYEIPSNLQNNPFNANITSATVGDIKNQYRSIFTNYPSATGQLFGSNNIHDLGNINNYGTSIIQNSASMVLPGVFLRKPETDIFKALQYNSEQYQIYKILLLDLAASTDFSVYTTPELILDDIISKIASTKNQSTAFFWSDMVPSGNPYITNTYTFNIDTPSVTIALSPEVWTDTMFTEANYTGIGVYLTREVQGRPVSTQLIKGVDYNVSTTPNSPNLIVDYGIQVGDTITVYQYNQTYGSYCPSTPSKLGLYPIYIPAIVQPSDSDSYFILGHDGSLNKLYGNYSIDVGTGIEILDDFRDQALFEFEKRIYNNYKVSSSIPLTSVSVIPGQFRSTDYTWAEILDIYSVQFLNWVGANRLDYKIQRYRANNQYSYNYNQSSDRLDKQQIQQGFWKGIYNWFYDTDNPAYAPWEMLGLVNKPDWWDTRYGAAPYTSGNTYMWSEIAAGYVWNDGQPYIDSSRVRPQLLEVLPVDSYGNMIAPFNAVVGNYNSLTFNNNWVVGDGAPVENAYLKSSAWPFDLMRLLVLTKPAEFFNFFADRDNYKFNSTLLTPGQYLYNDRYHLDPRTITVYGNGTAKHSYINWVVDYNNQTGANGYNVVSQILTNLDVRLTYNVAGFTAKNYLKFLIEKATPNSRNTSLLIPDENYSVLLYDNPTQENIIYSSVVVQKTAQGYTVWGNSKNKNYFTTSVSKYGIPKQITVGDQTVDVSTEFYADKTVTVPYGTVFYGVQAVAQFLLNYGNYLERQGVIFSNIEYGIPIDWFKMAQELVNWAQQQWEVGSIISLNPNSRNFKVNKPGLIPQPLTIQDQNFILNQNLLPINTQETCIHRQNELLEVTILTPADTVAYANINLNSIEHAVVFDNTTSFGDLIYNIQTGLRQQRLLLKGNKTGDWTGYINTSGFILNENNVKEWQPNVKYPKNYIVTFKSNYYTAVKLIEPAAEFSQEDWLKTDYGQIKEGLLPNPSTMAYESLYYYDTTRANLENDADLLSYSLIGFRPRDYMVAAELSDITQVNVYQNIIRYKGTKLLADSFRGVTFPQGSLDYKINENWAIKSGNFGALLNSNFIEAGLNQSLLTGNPTLLGFAPADSTLPDVQQSVAINNLINWERPPLTSNFLPLARGTYTTQEGLPSAGYVNLNDSKVQAYQFSNLNNNPTNLANLRAGNYVWIANIDSTWGIYLVSGLQNQVISAQNNLNGTATITFATPHGLVKDDLFAIINFDPTVNGFYRVNSVTNLNSLVITISLAGNTITGNGTGFQLISRRFEQAADATPIPPNSEWDTRKAWIDSYTDGQWAVYGSGIAYKEKYIDTNSVGYGVTFAYNSTVARVVADGAGNLYRYVDDTLEQTITGSAVGANVQVAVAGEYTYASSPDEGLVYIYRLNSITGELSVHSTLNVATYIASVTGAIAVSNDAKWLYVADATNQEIVIYAQNGSSTLYQYVDTYADGSVAASSGWGASLATSTDGVKLVVGAPYETVNALPGAGAVYVYSRILQNFYGDGSTVTFTTANSIPNNIADVYVNSIETTSTAVAGSTVTVYIPDPNDPLSLIPPPDGSIVAVSTGGMQFIQRFQSSNPVNGAWFGHTVDTNRYGADVVVGAPYEINEIDGVKNVEGAVYKFTNAGQRYGVVTSTVTGTHTGTMFIDGWLINYNGSITSIRDAINTQTPTNIIASVSGTTLTITVKDDTPETIYNVVDITGPDTDLAGLGITLYTQTQRITNHNLSTSCSYGYKVKMNERDGLLVSAITDIRRQPTTFDYTNDCVENDTVFDGSTTTFIDSFGEQGVVYVYDYLPAYNESITNPGQYAFGQYVSSSEITTGTPAPLFGSSLWYSNDTIIVGIPGYTVSSSAVQVFTTDWTPEPCEVNRPNPWYIDKQPLPVVDINAIQNICIYNRLTNETLEWLDYCDPLQGKLLGAVATNLDFLSSVDPAVYNQNSVSWSWDHVGNTWLDLSTIRLLNYHQPSYEYNAKNWGRAFPGSTADIYTWVESTSTPLNYSGSGFPLNFDKYTTVTSVDDSTNSLVTKYYFWVKNYREIPVGKNLSPIVLSTYILNPLNSGISFLAPITTDVVGMYNSGQYIQSQSSVLHLGYGLVNGKDDKHTSWSLIREGDPEDFLSGVPEIVGQTPSGLYLKLIESFSGFDFNDNPVPDPRLPELVKYGTAFRPRQSMFINREKALENYIIYANDILIKLPIAEIRNLSLLNTFGPTFDTRKFWEYADWWAEGYSSTTKAVVEVDSVNDLQTIIDNQLLININGVNTFLTDGLIAKVKENGLGNSEYYIYGEHTAQKWTRIGAERSTIQILPTLYDFYGWASEAWDLVWDKNVSQETEYIIRWLNEQCYIDDLAIERNASLILMFNYIQSESLQQNNYLPWLNKTSLIDVHHKIRDLLPYKNYQRDNQEFLEGFLNEIKPYHVLIKDFTFSYAGEDVYLGNTTDFDLPAEYNSTDGNFQSPQLVYSETFEQAQYLPSNIIWTTQEYNQWFENYGLSISNFGETSKAFTTLSEPITSTSTSAILVNVYGLPAVGQITIGTEDITYNSITLATNTLNGLTRGANGTTPASHSAGDTVYVDLPAVIVLDEGRGYLEPPLITAAIDTQIWPEPRTAAVFTPVMAADRLIGVQVENGGSGYAVEPTITATGSSITSTVTTSAFNATANTVTIANHPFQNGDPIVYTAGSTSTPPTGLRGGAWYYVRSINANTIALYEDYEDSVISSTSPYLHVSTNDGRVALIDTGSGTEHTFTVTARLAWSTSQMPVRGLKVSIKFDRTSYTASITPPTVANAADRIEEYYDPTPSMPGKNLRILMDGVDYPNAVYLDEQFGDGWDYTPYDIWDWAGSITGPLVDPVVDTNLQDQTFTGGVIINYDIDGDTFSAGYGPEELVPGYIQDSVVITITSNDLMPNWVHIIEIDRFGGMTVKNDSGSTLETFYLNRWWYGTPGLDPTTDPLANTTLSTNTSVAATFLRS